MIKKKQSKPTYSSEFKVESVAKCLEIGIKQTSEQLGVAPSTLNTWKKNLSSNDNRYRGNDKPSYQDLEREIRKLKKELGYITEINDVLKKSTAIFCKDQMGGLL